MSTLPLTGSISASNIVQEYGLSFSNALNWRGIHSNVPASGELRFSHFRGTNASVPTSLTIGTQSVATSGSGGTGTINIGSFVNDSNGRPFTVTILNSNPTYFSTVTVNSGSNIAYTTLANKWVTSASPANVSIKVVNRFGRSNTFNIPFSMYGAGISTSVIGDATLTGTGSSNISLGSFFTNNAPDTLSYSVSASYGSPSIVGSTLTLTGDAQNRSYSVTVTATNGYGQSASRTFNVTHLSMAPPGPGTSSFATPSTIYAYEVPTGYYFPYYFTGSNLSYYLTSNPRNNAIIDGANQIKVTGLLRNISYNVQITACNAAGSYTQTFPVVESGPREVDYIYDAGSNHTFIVPPLCSNISVLCIGGGGSGHQRSDGVPGSGGGGGGLAYYNNAAVTPGQSIPIVVGKGAPLLTNQSTVPTACNSSVIPSDWSFYCIATGGETGGAGYGDPGNGGAFDVPFMDPNAGGGRGGNGGRADSAASGKCGGGGGAGGYGDDWQGTNGTGGQGASYNALSTAGTGGGGGGGGAGYTNSNDWAFGGGGTGIYGRGTNGAAGRPTAGGGGSYKSTTNSWEGGASGNGDYGGSYGGGGAGGRLSAGTGGLGASGVVRILVTHSNTPRKFPSNAGFISAYYRNYKP